VFHSAAGGTTWSDSMSLDRRCFLRAGTASLAVTASGWFDSFARAAATDPKRTRSCILLWMSGGPATIDLWDLKPGHANGGPYKQIEAAPDLMIGEHLPKIAGHGKNLALIRGMSTKEGDHGRATFLMRTGVLPQAGIDFPSIGALVAKELHSEGADLPPFVAIAPQRGVAQNAFGPGFLGPKFSPLIVADGQQARGDGAGVDQQLKVQNLDRYSGVAANRAEERLTLLSDLESGFVTDHPGAITDSHKTALAAAVRMMRPETAKAFDLSEEKSELRDRYGRNLFGQGCLLARRLVERGVPFVEVTLDGWDTHGQNFEQVKNLCGTLDPAWATLMSDLSERGLLDTTTIIWMGEFGRTPKINNNRGRDHFPDAWSAVLAGGGIKGGQAYGKTTKDGMKVEDKQTGIPDLLATLCKALGIDHEKQNMSNVNRPIRIVDRAGNPIREVLS
jgi:hypothetical protein